VLTEPCPPRTPRRSLSDRVRCRPNAQPMRTVLRSGTPRRGVMIEPSMVERNVDPCTSAFPAFDRHSVTSVGPPVERARRLALAGSTDPSFFTVPLSRGREHPVDVVGFDFEFLATRSTMPVISRPAPPPGGASAARRARLLRAFRGAFSFAPADVRASSRSLCPRGGQGRSSCRRSSFQLVEPSADHLPRVVDYIVLSPCRPFN